MYLRADWPGKLRRAPDELDFLTSITFLAEARFKKDHCKIHSFSLSFWKEETDFTVSRFNLTTLNKLLYPIFCLF